MLLKLCPSPPFACIFIVIVVFITEPKLFQPRTHCLYTNWYCITYLMNKTLHTYTKVSIYPLHQSKQILHICSVDLKRKTSVEQGHPGQMRHFYAKDTGDWLGGKYLARPYKTASTRTIKCKFKFKFSSKREKKLKIWQRWSEGSSLTRYWYRGHKSGLEAI